MGSIIRSSGKVFNSLLYLNLRLGFDGLKYLYSVISVKIDPLPGNTKNRESTRSWTARVRFVHPWADRMAQNLEIISKTFNLVPGVPGFSIYYLVQIVNPMGRILVRWKSFFIPRNSLEILCHPICIRLYIGFCTSTTWTHFDRASRKLCNCETFVCTKVE